MLSNRRPKWLAAVLLAAIVVSSIGARPALRPAAAVAAPGDNTSGTISAPAGEGSPGVGWQGTVPTGGGGVDPATCVDGFNAWVYTLTLNGVTPSYYNTHSSTFSARIDWDAVGGNVTTQDLALFLTEEDGTAITSSDGGDNRELVVHSNLPGGVYKIIVCGFANVAPQPFNAQAFFNVVGGGDVVPAPEDGARDIQFSASTITDPQRDVAEPSLRVDKNDNIYACGPYGSSRGADYATKSEDVGDTFRILGQPPEGRIATEGGGDCELAVGTVLTNGEYTLAYTGLEALVNFSTGRSTDAGRSFIGQNLAVTNVGVDRQWMEASGAEEVYLGYNAIATGYEVARSIDGGFTYQPSVVAATGIFRPGPIRIDENPAHNPLYSVLTPTVNDEIIYFAYTKADGVWVGRSYDEGATWENFEVASGFNPNNLFAVLGIDTAGNLYAAWTEKGSFNTYYAYSLRPGGAGGAGSTWSSKRLVNRAPVYSTVMPWIEAGDPGRIVVSYYGTQSNGNIEVGDFKAYWDVYVSTSFNALDPNDGDENFALNKVTTHPIHWDSICVSGLGCDLAVPAGDRSLLDFFQNRIDKRGGIHVVYNESNKIPGAGAGRLAIVTYAKQIGGVGMYTAQTPTVDPRPVVRSSSTDPTGDAKFPFSSFGTPPPTRYDLDAADITQLKFVQPPGAGLEAGAFNINLSLLDASDAALAQALADQNTAGSPAASLVYVVRWFSGTDPYAAVAKWQPGVGFTFGMNDFQADPSGKLEIYPGSDHTIPGCRVGNTLVMSVKPSDFLALDIPASPTGTATIRTAVSGDRIFEVTAFTFGNQSAVPETQSYLNQGDSTASYDYVLGASLAGGIACPGTPNLSDLSITKTDSPDPVQAGGLLTYTLTVINSGGQTATNVRVTDTVPADTTFISCGGDGACSETGGTVTWNVGSLAGSDSATVTFTVQTDLGLSNGSTIENDGYLVDSDQTDPAGGPRVTTQVTTVPSPSLSIGKTAGPVQVMAGRLLTYTLTVSNDSATPATGVVVSDTLPADTTYQSCSGAPCVQDNNSVIWTVGTLAANSQTTLTLVVEVLPATQGGTPIQNLTYEVDSVQTNPVQGPPVVVRVAHVRLFPLMFR